MMGVVIVSESDGAMGQYRQVSRSVKYVTPCLDWLLRSWHRLASALSDQQTVPLSCPHK